TGGVPRVAGAECTARGTGFTTWTAGFVFFFTAGLGFVWRGFRATFAFARVAVCFGVVACVRAELGCVDAGGGETTGADGVAVAGVTTGAGVGAGAGAGGGVEVCVLPLDVDFWC